MRGGGPSTLHPPPGPHPGCLGKAGGLCQQLNKSSSHPLLKTSYSISGRQPLDQWEWPRCQLMMGCGPHACGVNVGVWREARAGIITTIITHSVRPRKSPSTVTLGPRERTGHCGFWDQEGVPWSGQWPSSGQSPERVPRLLLHSPDGALKPREVCEFPRAHRQPAQASGHKSRPQMAGKGGVGGGAGYEIGTCWTDAGSSPGSATY